MYIYILFTFCCIIRVLQKCIRWEKRVLFSTNFCIWGWYLNTGKSVFFKQLAGLSFYLKSGLHLCYNRQQIHSCVKTIPFFFKYKSTSHLKKALYFQKHCWLQALRHIQTYYQNNFWSLFVKFYVTALNRLAVTHQIRWKIVFISWLTTLVSALPAYGIW